jgi:small-conductance mechanosensitive channel
MEPITFAAILAVVGVFGIENTTQNQIIQDQNDYIMRLEDEVLFAQEQASLAHTDNIELRNDLNELEQTTVSLAGSHAAVSAREVAVDEARQRELKQLLIMIEEVQHQVKLLRNAPVVK